jgi:hypothetical protein
MPLAKVAVETSKQPGESMLGRTEDCHHGPTRDG